MSQTVLLVTHGAFLNRDRVATGNSVRGYYLSKALVDHGVRVCYAYPRELSGGAAAPDEADVPVAEFGDRRELASLIDRVAPDAILVGYWELLELLPEPLGVPVILDLLAPRVLETRFQGGRSLAEEIARMLSLYRKADRFITGTRRQKDLLLPWLMMAGFDCRERPPIDVVPISAEPAEPRTLEGPDPVWGIVTAGVDWPWRRSEDYLAAAVSGLTDPSGMKGELWWVSGPYPYGLAPEEGGAGQQGAEAASPLAHRLPLLTYGGMEDLLRRCHIGLELSEHNVEREYSLSFRSIEYLRCGLPVVCNDYLELAGHVRDYGAGWVVASPQEMAPLLASIAADRADYARRSEGAIRLVRDRFHYRETIRPLLGFLQQPVVPYRARSPLAVQAGALRRHQLKVREQSLRLQVREREVDDLQARLGETQGSLDDLRWQVDASREAMQRRERDLDEAHANLSSVRRDLDERQRALMLAEARTQEILASHSWRLTAPLRGLSRGLRAMVAVWRARRPRLRSALADWPGRSTAVRLLREAWNPPAEAGCGKAVGQTSVTDGAEAPSGRPARRRSGRHIAIVTRKDLFPADHGAAVKVERTAWGLSHYADSVLLVTADWVHYWVFEKGRMRRACYPRWVRLSGVLALRAARKLRRIGVPDKEAFLFYPIFDWSYFLRLVYVSWRHRVALYQAEFPAYARACLWARRLFGGKTLLVEHNVEFARIADQFPDMSERARSWLERVEVDLCNRVDRVVAVSEPDRAALVAAGVHADRLAVIPHGVDLSLYERRYDFDLRRQFGLERDLPLLVYHGIYSYYPNLEAVRLIAAELLPRLVRRGYRAKVLAIGRDPPEAPVHEDVIFAGSVSNLAPYLKNADLAVVPLQKGGGTRMKILEYFAAGVPVIATSKAMEGIPVENGVEAWIEDDFEAMADAVVTLLQDRPRAQRLSSAARRYVRDLDWTAIARRYLDLVRWDPEPGPVGAGAAAPQAGLLETGMQQEQTQAEAGHRGG
jgi:glycosyltransferase involved in cell wall biosynthesis